MKRVVTIVALFLTHACGSDPASLTCADITCPDNASCEMAGEFPQCICDDGLAGLGCDTCAAGYHDENGSCVLDQSCLPSTCSGAAGSCDDSSGSVACTCSSGYEGTYCASCASGYHRNNTGACVADESCAAANPCQQGTCDDTGGEISCSCSAGWTGENCDACAAGYHDENGSCVLDQTCLPSTCSGAAAGSCSDTSGVVACTCNTGYEGTYCASCVSGYHRDNTGACVMDESCATANPCQQGTCNDTGGEISCTCSAGWAGENCDTCAAGFHDENGNCVLDQTCLPSTCSGAAGSCDDTGGVVACTCNTGYEGTYCASCTSGYHRDGNGDCVADESCAVANPCQQGTCSDTGGEISCSCHAGWAGENCDTCAPGFHDENGNCVLDQTCLPGSCSNAGTCDDTGGVVTCSCQAEFAGNYCESCATGYAGSFCQTCDTNYARNGAGDCAPDSDGDGTVDTEDECPQNSNMQAQNVCGACDTPNPPDTDGDGLADCIDDDTSFTVNTAFDSGNQGNMFDFEVHTDMVLRSITIGMNGCFGSPHNVRAYMKSGTHVGNESSVANWTLVFDGTLPCSNGGFPLSTTIPLGDYTVLAGNRYAIYVAGIDRGTISTWTGSIGNLFATDGNLSVYLGRAMFGTFQPYSTSSSSMPPARFVYNTF